MPALVSENAKHHLQGLYFHLFSFDTFIFFRKQIVTEQSDEVSLRKAMKRLSSSFGNENNTMSYSHNNYLYEHY